MDNFLQAFFDLDVMAQSLPLLLRGALVTLQLCAVVIGLGLAGGLALALAALSPRRWLRWPAVCVIDFFRALPPLVLLIFVYSGLPFAGLDLSPFVAVVIAFLLNNSAYFAEVFRAGINSVPNGQMEAARATGLTGVQAMTHVLLPQAVRNVLPDLLSNTVEVVKPLVLAAILYLLVLWPLVRVISRYQRGLAIH